MKPTLLHWDQFEILEKIASGMQGDDLLIYERVNLIDDKTGELLYPITKSWKPIYVLEAFVNGIESILLSEQVDIVIPESMLENGIISVPEYSNLLPSFHQDFLKFPIANADNDKGAIDTSFYELLFEGNADSSVMIAKAYNGQFGPVALRVSQSDYKAFMRYFVGFSNKISLPKRLIDKAYDELLKSYNLKLSEIFQNSTELILPPLVTNFLERLPDKCDNPETFKDALLRQRYELRKVRERFSEFQEIDDDPSKSIKDAEKIYNAIKADSKYFIKKWNSNITDNNIIQFCIDNMSFLVKLILKSHEVEPEEIAGKIIKIAPGLEKRIRSSAPTILSKWALNTRKIKGIVDLLDRKLSLNFNEIQKL